MTTNLPAYNIFRYFCTTEQQYVFERRVGTALPPTVCKNDGDPITNLSVYKKISKLNGPLLKINGTTISEVSPNYIDFNSIFYNVSDYGNGISKVLLKVDDNSTASDVLWSANKINNVLNSSSTYTVKVSQNDTTPNYLSSSIIDSNNIRYTIINPGADEKYQAFVNTSDGIIGTDIIWSSNYINSQLYTVKITSSDITPNYLASSIISSNNTLNFNVNGNPGAEQKLDIGIADPLTLNSLLLNSSLTVNNIQGINGTDVNINSYLQYDNRGILVNSGVSTTLSNLTPTLLRFNNIVAKNNDIVYNGSSVFTVNTNGWYYINGQTSIKQNSNSSINLMLAISKNSVINPYIAQTNSITRSGSKNNLYMNVSTLDYVSSSTTYSLWGILSSSGNEKFNVNNGVQDHFGIVYLGN